MSNALTLTSNLPKDIVVVQAPLVAEFDQAMAEANALTDVVDADSATAATKVNTKLSRLSSAITKARKTLTKPIDDLKAQVMAKEKEFLAPIDAARSAIETELSNYLAKVQEEQRQREFVRQQEQNVATTQGEARMTPALVPMDPQPEVGVIKTRRVAHLIIVDIRLVPPQFLEVMEGPLKQYLLEGKQTAGAYIQWKDDVVA